MCQYLTDITAYIAEKDITVYKTYIRNNSKFAKSKFLTAWQYVEVNLKVLQQSKIVVDIRTDLTPRINIGLHSYVNKSDAAIVAQQWQEVLIEAMIPKGSTYYKGNDGKRDTYVSDKLIALRTLNAVIK